MIYLTLSLLVYGVLYMKRAISPLSKRTLLVLQTFGRMIKSARLERNMSQEMLAARLNVSRLTVIALEKGSPNVSIGTFFEAAAIVNIPILSEDDRYIQSTWEKITQINKLLPKRGGRQKKEINDDF